MPVGNYNATFIVATIPYGFDVRTNGYTGPVEANRTVEPIPWAQVYSVVRQDGGLLPHTRQYRALVYLEQDFINLAVQVHKVGTLTTPREGSVLAALEKVERGQDVDPTTPTGMTTVQMDFTILQ